MTQLRVGPEDSGRTVEVGPRDRLVIALPETAGTGYRWTMEALPRGARILEERYEHAEKAPIGSASLHVLVLEGATSGTLRLRHSRPGQDEDAVLERFELILRAPSSSPPAP